MTPHNRICKKLNEASRSGDNNKIISALIEMRREMLENKNLLNLDKSSYQTLITFLKIPNTKVIDYTLSILGNLCLHENYRRMFGKLGGLSHLVLVIQTIDNESILCRASRLIGNLAKEESLGIQLVECNIGTVLLKILEKHTEMDPGSIAMTFRALIKLWKIEECNKKLFSEDVCKILTSCLHSNDHKTVKLAVEALSLFSALKNSSKTVLFEIRKELLLRLVELTKDKQLKLTTIKCLSNIIYHHYPEVQKHLEGSGIGEVFIDFFQEVDNIDPIIFEALYQLCTEGAIRRKVRVSSLLIKLLKLGLMKNSEKILQIFYLFQYDVQSIGLLSQNKSFISFLFKNVKYTAACKLLEVVSRIEPPVMELVENENLDIILKNKQCFGVLKNIAKEQKFFRSILLSGKIWEICRAGCSMEDVGCSGFAEGTIIHLLSSGDKKCKENVSLAVPFLVKPRDFKRMYKLLAHHQAIITIINLLQDNPLEESILASVIRLINIFKVNYSNGYEDKSFFQDFTVSNDSEMSESSDEHNFIFGKEEFQRVPVSNSSEREMITFNFDDGTSATANGNLLSKNSPVLNAMLNGHFIEASQQTVNLSCCSKEAFLHLIKLLEDDTVIPNMSIEIHLELISLTDRFLIFSLNDLLTASLVITGSSCLAVYQWCRNAGHTRNNSIIRQQAYDILLSSSEYLILGMKNDYCRDALVQEISLYLSNSLKDLL